MGKNIGMCSIIEDECRDENIECKDCSIMYIHKNLEQLAEAHKQGRLIILDKHIECKDCKYFSGGEPYDGNRHWCSKDAPDDSCEVDETDFCKEAEAKLNELKGE